MKRSLSVFTLVGIFLIIASGGARADYLLWYEYEDNIVSYNLPANEGWYQFNIDGSEIYNKYTSGSLTEFKITFKGYESYAGDIDTFLDFNSPIGGSDAVNIANWNHTGRYGKFYATYDFLNDDFWVGDTYDSQTRISDLSNWDPDPNGNELLDMANFAGKNNFWLGFGCEDFYKYYAKGVAEYSGHPPSAIPEPATLFLVGSGLCRYNVPV